MSEAAKQDVPVRSLVRKLAEVMGEVERIAKNGKNNFHNYDYATESDITAAVRKHMAERHLMLFPSVKKTEWEKVVSAKGGEKKICTLTVEFTVEDGDSGETRRFEIMGQGEDTGDKATYKAMTGAEKYALLKLFMIPTGDDPEKDSEHSYKPGKEQPKNDDKPAPNRKGTHPGASMAIKYGEGKGKTIGELTDAELAWQLDAADKAVRANDPKWHKANLTKQAALQAEAQVRISATPSGHLKAPANTSPRQTELAPVAEDEGEEIITPQQRFFTIARESGLGPAKLTARAKGVLNKTAGYTHEDIDTLVASLKAVPA